MVAKMETESPTRASARDSTSNKLDPTVAISTIELIEVPIEKVASPRTATKLAAVHNEADLVISDGVFSVEIRGAATAFLPVRVGDNSLYAPTDAKMTSNAVP